MKNSTAGSVNSCGEGFSKGRVARTGLAVGEDGRLVGQWVVAECRAGPQGSSRGISLVPGHLRSVQEPSRFPLQSPFGQSGPPQKKDAIHK